VEKNINEVQKQVCLGLIDQAGKDGIQVDIFAIVDPTEANWPSGEKNPVFLKTVSDSPLPKMRRRDPLTSPPEEIIKQLRNLLMNPDVAAQHDEIRVVLVTPYQRAQKNLADNPDFKWLLARTKECHLNFSTVVLGDQAATLEDLDKIYPNPRL